MANYCDILLLGRSGRGRTTLATKLLDLENTDSSAILRRSSTGPKSCELTSVEGNNFRVVDVPGFSDGASPQEQTLQENEKIIYSIGVAQEEFQLRVNRIVYFLPRRGPLEKADGDLQEELHLLGHYFGQEVFDCMVVAATTHKKNQHFGFDDDELEQTKEVFHIALKSAVSEDMSCPPIVYISLNDNPRKTLSTVKTASVWNKGIFPLIMKDVGPLYPDPVEEDPMPVEKNNHPNFTSQVCKIIGGFFSLTLHVLRLLARISLRVLGDFIGWLCRL